MLDRDQISEIQPEDQLSVPRRHPEANTALFLGIAAIVLAAGALGLACAIFSMIAASRTLKDYRTDPDLYTKNSHTRAIAGMVCSIVSILILFVFALFLVSYL